jgi:formate-dependent nitrite reductase membrane component NrfD
MMINTTDAQRPRYDTMRSEILLPTLRAGREEGTVGGTPTTYYGRPMIKPPTWKWLIPLYLWLGGIAGGAAVIGAMAEFFGGPQHRATIRHARWLTATLAALCPILLVRDLGRPARFHHMLRVIKVSSPLNLGTWILIAFNLTSSILAARQAAEDGFILRRRSVLGRLATLIPSGPLTALHALLGACFGGYTGVLLAATAIPLWAAAGILLGPLFLATAVASGAAALTLLGALTGSGDAGTRHQIEAVESAAIVTQLGLVVARGVLVPPAINKPLRTGLWGNLFRFGAVGGGMAGPLVLRLGTRLSGRRTGRALAITGASLTLLGALAERFAITEAGKASAADPLAYQAMTQGAPGEARPTPEQQAHNAPPAPAYRAYVAISEP